MAATQGRTDARTVAGCRAGCGAATPSTSAVIAAGVLFALFACRRCSALLGRQRRPVAIYAIVALGLGLLVGRVGMVSLGQGAVLGAGRLGRRPAAVRHRAARTRSCCSLPG